IRIAQLAHHAHYLVVTDEWQHASGGFRSILLEAAQQIERLPRIGATIHDVAVLHEVGLSTRPLFLLVNNPGGAKNLDEAVVGSVDVANGENPLNTVDAAGIRRDFRLRGDDARDKGDSG